MRSVRVRILLKANVLIGLWWTDAVLNGLLSLALLNLNACFIRLLYKKAKTQILRVIRPQCQPDMQQAGPVAAVS